MAIEIDNKKMLESLRKAMWYFPEAEWLTRSIDTALSEQGLTVNDKGEITTIEPEVKWYVAIDDYGIYESIMSQVPIFHKGEMTTKEKVYTYFPNMTDEEFNKHFRPATKEDIQKYALENPLVGEFDFPDYDKPATEEEIQQTSTKPYNPEHQGAANDHVESKPEPNKCLFTKDLYTDEERKELCEGCQEECELNKHTELEDVLVNFIGEIDGDYCVHISSYDDYINKFAPKILVAARKIVASKLESMVDTMVSQNGGMCVHYREGIEDAINKIKGESV